MIGSTKRTPSPKKKSITKVLSWGCIIGLFENPNLDRVLVVAYVDYVRRKGGSSFFPNFVRWLVGTVGMKVENNSKQTQTMLVGVVPVKRDSSQNTKSILHKGTQNQTTNREEFESVSYRERKKYSFRILRPQVATMTR